jgi:hypothetical protein
MIRNKPDSYCQAHDVETEGIRDLVADLVALYSRQGVHPSARPAHLARSRPIQRRSAIDGVSDRLRRWWLSVKRQFAA